MAYTIERATLIAKELERFASSHPHQLAGQFANLDFWLDEAGHALAMIDDYPHRFRRLRDAQVAWVQGHGTTLPAYCPVCGGGCEFGPFTPPAPQWIPTEQMDAARRAVRQGVYRLLLRCHRVGLLDEAAVRAACDRFGVTVERDDLEAPPVERVEDPSPTESGGTSALDRPRRRSRR